MSIRVGAFNNPGHELQRLFDKAMVPLKKFDSDEEPAATSLKKQKVAEAQEAPPACLRALAQSIELMAIAAAITSVGR